MRAEPRLTPPRAFVKSFHLPVEKQNLESFFQPRKISKDLPTFTDEKASLVTKLEKVRSSSRELFALDRQRNIKEMFSLKKNVPSTPSDSLKTKTIRYGYGSFKGTSAKAPPAYSNFKPCGRTPRSILSSRELTDGRRMARIRPSLASTLIEPKLFSQTSGRFPRKVDRIETAPPEDSESRNRGLQHPLPGSLISKRYHSTRASSKKQNEDFWKFSFKSLGMIKALNSQKRLVANPIKSSLQGKAKANQIHKSKTQPELVTGTLIHFEGLAVDSRNIQAIRENKALTDTKKIELLLQAFDEKATETRESPSDGANEDSEQGSKSRSFLEEIPEDEKEDEEHDLTIKERLGRNKSTNASACKSDRALANRVRVKESEASSNILKSEASDQKLIRLSMATIGL